MRSIRSVLARHPLASYLVLAFGVSWALTAALSVSIVFGILALFGPAIAALVVAWADGSGAELRSRITGWRRTPSWYLIAFLTPFAVAGIARLVHAVTDGNPLGLGSVSAIEIVIFGLVIGEEIGWRGFLHPRLQATRSVAAAGLLTGVAWTLWHLPLYLGSGLAAFAAFAWWVIPFSMVLGYVARGARFSVLVATVMHGAANVSMPILLPGVDLTWSRIVTGSVWVALAAILAWRERATVRARGPVVTTASSSVVADQGLVR